MTELNPDGLAVEPAPGIVLRTPGLRGEVVVHVAGSDGTRGAEETREELLAALAHNEMEEDLTLEIREPRETSASEGSRAAGGDDNMTVEVPDPGGGWAQVVLYESEDGVLSWHLPVERNAGTTTRGSGTLTYSLPRTVAVDEDQEGGQRGLLGAVGSKIIKALTFRLVRAGARWAGQEFGRQIESRFKKHALVRFAPDCYADPHPQRLTDPEVGALGGGRALLLVHGTFSTAYGAFHRLPPELLAALYDRYDGRVFAFDHPTVATSPVENVAALADLLNGFSLPPLEVDVLSHSRGGLVGRVLTEQAALGRLDGRLAVRNLVMVATPNAGTSLADMEHLEHLLNRITTLLQLVPDNGVTDALDVILAVLKQVAAGLFSGLDGLMSMNPNGPFLTKTLNRPGHTAATYFAAAADYDPPGGSKLTRIARDGLTDVVFGPADNDLVVPTQGAFTVAGAGTFPIADPLLFDGPAGVDHGGYWSRTELADRLTTWLPG
jgi:hypothetical protein